MSDSVHKLHTEDAGRNIWNTKRGRDSVVDACVRACVCVCDLVVWKSANKKKYVGLIWGSIQTGSLIVFALEALKNCGTEPKWFLKEKEMSVDTPGP
jgi:hypothetical protein